MARTEIHVIFSGEVARNEEQTLMMKKAFRKNVKGFDVFLPKIALAPDICHKEIGAKEFVGLISFYSLVTFIY